MLRQRAASGRARQLLRVSTLSYVCGPAAAGKRAFQSAGAVQHVTNLEVLSVRLLLPQVKRRRYFEDTQDIKKRKLSERFKKVFRSVLQCSHFA